jgi:hypothetical protein
MVRCLMMLILLAVSDALITNLKSSRKHTAARFMQEPRRDRDQLLNIDRLKFAGTLLGSLLLYPAISRAKDSGISDIMINYEGVPKPIG